MPVQPVDATPPDINLFPKGGVHDAETMEAVFGPAGRYVEPLEACQTHRRRKDGKGNAAKQFAFDITDITSGTSYSPGKGQPGTTVARR